MCGNEPSYEGVNSNDPNEENTTEEREDPMRNKKRLLKRPKQQVRKTKYFAPLFMKPRFRMWWFQISIVFIPFSFFLRRKQI